MKILFDVNEGKSARQLTFENAYTNKGIDLESIFYQALELTISNPAPPHFRGRGFWSNNMSWNIIGLLKENFGDLVLHDEFKRPYFSLEHHLRIYFKKFNTKYMPDNIMTNHVRDMNTMSLQLNDDPITVLYAGFRIRQNKYWDNLDGCYLIEMKSLTQINWISDLSYLSDQMNGNSEITVLPIKPIILPDEITVSGKKDQVQRKAN